MLSQYHITKVGFKTITYFLWFSFRLHTRYRDIWGKNLASFRSNWDRKKHIGGGTDKFYSRCFIWWWLPIFYNKQSRWRERKSRQTGNLTFVKKLKQWSMKYSTEYLKYYKVVIHYFLCTFFACVVFRIH